MPKALNAPPPSLRDPLPAAHPRARRCRAARWLLLGALLLARPAAVRAADAFDEGLAQLDSGQWLAAEESFERLAEEHPESPLAHYYAGLAALGAEHPMRAALAFARAAALDPGLPSLRAKLGIALFRAGDLELAEAQLLEALSVDPDDPSVLIHLGLIDREYGQNADAIVLFSEAAALEPDRSARPWLYAARAALAQGETDSVLEYLSRAIAAPGPPAAREHAGALLSSLLGTAPDRPVTRGWWINASAGLEYDDNAFAARPDESASDLAGVFDLDFTHRTLRSDGLGGSVSYAFRQSVHRDFEGLDLQSHAPSAELTDDWGGVRPHARYTYTHESLGRRAFLDSHEIDVSLERGIWASWRFWVGGEFENLDFAGGSIGDAQRWAIVLDQQIDLLDDRLGLLLGWRPEWYRARNARLDYSGQRVSGALASVIPSPLFPFGALFVDLFYEFEYRNYANAGPARQEAERHTLEAKLVLPLSQHFEGELGYEHIRVGSDFPSSNYRENLVAFRIRYSF